MSLSVLLAIAITVWLAWQPHDTATPASPVGGPSLQQEAHELEQQDHATSFIEEGSEAGTAIPQDEAVREPVRVDDQPLLVRGMIEDESGSPIPGALITCTPISPGDFKADMPTTLEQRETMDSATVRTQSDLSGQFQVGAGSFEAPVQVLWATALGFEGQARILEGPTTELIRLKLDRAPLRDVRVVDAFGAPVAGAVVEHFGVSAIDRQHGDPLLIAGGKAFRRLSITDDDGRPVPPLMPTRSGEAAIARMDGMSSDSWVESRTILNPQVELVFADSFSCFGKVTATSQDINLGKVVIEARGLRESYSGPLMVAPVQPDGSWGPAEVSLREGWEYVLTLSGPGVANDLAMLGRPRPGERLRQDFKALPELKVVARAAEASGIAVPNAQVIAQWAQGDFAVNSYSTTDSEGLAEIHGVRPGWVQFLATADGYTDFRGEWMELSTPPESPISFELEPSRSVRGRVIGGDEPIEDFRVVWWTARSLSASVTTRVDFEGRTDGTFELESAPRDTIWLMAAADGFSRSGFVRADEGAEGEVVLELMPACSARGIVVDAESGDPIPGSTVQLWMNRGNFYLDARNAPVVVDAEGRFVLEGLAPGDNRLVVEAPGYSRYLAVAFGEPGRDVDMGAIAMQRTRELALVLVGDGPVDPTGFVANLKGTRYHEPVTFDADGVARFENVSPGIATWRVDGPDGFLRREIHVLAPDAEWVFEVQAEGGPVLEVQVVSPSGGAVPRGLVLTAFAAPGVGVATPGLENLAWVAVDDEGRALVRGLPAGPVAVEVRDEDGAVSGAHGVLEPDGSRLEVLWLPRAHDFRVEDETGRPVSEADVFLLPGEQATTWNAAGPTDDSGRVTIAGLPFDDVLVGAKHPELGMLPVRRVRLSEEGGSTTLRFGARSGLDVLLLEGGAPSPGTQVSLFTGGSFVVGDIASDGDGRLRWPNLAEGLYDLRVVHPGFWPGHARVATADDGEPVELTIHRRGSIELRLVTGADKPVAGQALELEHLGLGETPADWVGLGLLSGAAAQTASDGQGRVAIEGWPRGTYAWRAERPDGTSASGQFELAPGANAALELRLP